MIIQKMNLLFLNLDMKIMVFGIAMDFLLPENISVRNIYIGRQKGKGQLCLTGNIKSFLFLLTAIKK